MQSELIQNLRYKLQKRVRKLNAAGYDSFHFSLVRFWSFVEQNHILSGLLESMAVLVESAKSDAATIVAGQTLHGETEAEEACWAYWVLKSCVENPSYQKNSMEINIAQAYARGATKHDDALEYFKDLFVEPLYEYLDEQLDDQRAMLSLLRQ